MKIVLIHLFIQYFLWGQIILPQGNFGLLPQLHSMYQHCRETEDKDMTPLDFVTDHLICLDGLFDSHANGDEQKPHRKVISEIQFQPVFISIPAIQTPVRLVYFFERFFLTYKASLYCFQGENVLFRPPILIS